MIFFDIRVFDSNAKWYEAKTRLSCYRTNEMEKKRKCNERIWQVENGSFTPLVFSINGGMGKKANKYYSQIAEKLMMMMFNDDVMDSKKNILFDDEISHYMYSWR